MRSSTVERLTDRLDRGSNSVLADLDAGQHDHADADERARLHDGLDENILTSRSFPTSSFVSDTSDDSVRAEPQASDREEPYEYIGPGQVLTV